MNKPAEHSDPASSQLYVQLENNEPMVGPLVVDTEMYPAARVIAQRIKPNDQLKDYSQTELLLAVRQERHRLIMEKRGLTQRLATIGDRLDQLEKAENLLDNGF
jgi:hypothetical protein